ncbi:MAG: thioredoxin family protein [Elusimicrobia bacterium]|nr:thioredoxin family protein [Elusimicrobiota bacterium]
MVTKMFSQALLSALCLSGAAAQEAEPKGLLERFPREPLINEIVFFKPVSGHHFNEQAGADCGGGRRLESGEKAVRCQYGKPGRVEAKLYVCDDAKTFCRQEKAELRVGGSAAKGQYSEHPRKISRSPNVAAPGFIQNDVSKALELAKSKKSPILIFFTQLYCPPCNLFKEVTLSDAAFQKETEELVKLQVDWDVEIPERLTGLEVPSTPALLLVDRELREIGRFARFSSPELTLRWIREQSALADSPVETLAKKEKRSLAEAKRLGRWWHERKEHEKAVAALAAYKESDAEAGLYHDWAAAQSKKGEDYLQAVGPLVGRITDCQSHYPLWRLIPEEKDKVSDNYYAGAIEIIRGELRRTESGGARLDCLLNRAYLNEILAGVRMHQGDRRSARAAIEEAVSAYQGFQIHTPQGRGKSPKVYQAMAWSRIQAGEGEKLYHELKAEDPANFSYEYLQASELLDQKLYERALETLAKAEAKAMGNNWFRIKRLKTEILVKAGRKEEARRHIAQALTQVRLPASETSSGQRFVGAMRRFEAELAD